MKYFKVTNVNDPEEEFYVSSTLPNETPIHLAMALHLGEGDGRYDIKEVSADEFYRESVEGDSKLTQWPPKAARDPDCESDWDYRSEDDSDCFCD